MAPITNSHRSTKVKSQMLAKPMEMSSTEISKGAKGVKGVKVTKTKVMKVTKKSKKVSGV